MLRSWEGNRSGVTLAMRQTSCGLYHLWAQRLKMGRRALLFAFQISFFFSWLLSIIIYNYKSLVSVAERRSWKSCSTRCLQPRQLTAGSRSRLRVRFFRLRPLLTQQVAPRRGLRPRLSRKSEKNGGRSTQPAQLSKFGVKTWRGIAADLVMTGVSFGGFVSS